MMKGQSRIARWLPRAGRSRAIAATAGAAVIALAIAAFVDGARLTSAANRVVGSVLLLAGAERAELASGGRRASLRQYEPGSG